MSHCDSCDDDRDCRGRRDGSCRECAHCGGTGRCNCDECRAKAGLDPSGINKVICKACGGSGRQ